MSDSPRRRWTGLVFAGIAVALIIVDPTIVDVAVPSIVVLVELGVRDRHPPRHPDHRRRAAHGR